MEHWLTESKCAGIVKKMVYQCMQIGFQFSPWHITPINERPYALEVYHTLNHYFQQSKPPYAPVVEVGCGLGDVIHSLKWKYGKIGLDVSPQVLKAAKWIHPDIRYYKGTFTNIHCRNIKCLIMINFIHAIPYEELKRQIHQVMSKNKVELFVFDTFLNNKGTEYIYSHNGNELFDGKYICIKRSKGFTAAHGARRYIEYWRIR